MSPRPERVVAFLGCDRGGLVRNPAFSVLQRHGLIDPGLGYRAWLDTLARPSSKGWAVSTPDDPATPAGRFRRGLADYALADLDGRGRSPRLDALMADLRHGCWAVGVVVPDEPRLAHDVLLDLLNSPWAAADVPNAAPIQVLALGVDPRIGPGSGRFRTGLAEVNFDDLGADPDRYRPASPEAIRAAMGGPSRRGGKRSSRRGFAVRGTRTWGRSWDSTSRERRWASPENRARPRLFS